MKKFLFLTFFILTIINPIFSIQKEPNYETVDINTLKIKNSDNYKLDFYITNHESFLGDYVILVIFNKNHDLYGLFSVPKDDHLLIQPLNIDRIVEESRELTPRIVIKYFSDFVFDCDYGLKQSLSHSSS